MKAFFWTLVVYAKCLYYGFLFGLNPNRTDCAIQIVELFFNNISPKRNAQLSEKFKNAFPDLYKIL
jgi:hypothetical protein